MMENYKCVVVANGLFPSGELALRILNQAEYIIACDGAVSSPGTTRNCSGRYCGGFRQFTGRVVYSLRESFVSVEGAGDQ